MHLKFWGVRGSAAVPGPSTVQFGGNTSCVELTGSGVGPPHQTAVLFDSGTGIRAAGVHLMGRAAGRPVRVHLFLTHFHWDHIQGLPFFAPVYVEGSHITIYSSGFTGSLRQALEGLMSAPYYPVPFSELPAKIELVEMDGEGVEIGPLRVTPIEVNHPQGACAYRVEEGSVRAVYAPDREHGDERLDALFLDAVRGATSLVTDAQYTPEEYGSHRGWGHSTWAEAAKVAREAGVEELVLFHHDPAHSDDVLKRIEHDARQVFPHTFVAKEGWSFEL